MKFNDRTIEYLKGDTFSNSYLFSIAHKENKIIDRLNYLSELVQNKKIIHLGCTDHKEILDYKIANNLWLHKRLSESASYCLGVDINKEMIETVKQNYNITNIICADILNSKNKKITAEKWDYMILGEVLEHIDNPVFFLQKIKDNFKHNLSAIVLTVPNAFALRNIKNIYHNCEELNTDHRYYFTPYTLGKILTLAGYKVNTFTFAETMPIIPFYKHGRYMFHDIIHKMRMKKHPGLRAHLIMEASLF